MSPISLSVCSQCRHALFGGHSDSWLSLASLSFKRHQSGSTSSWNRRNSPPGPHGPQHGYQSRPRPPWKENQENTAPKHTTRPPGNAKGEGGHNRRPRNNQHLTWRAHTKSLVESPKLPGPSVNPNNIPAFFEDQVQRWSERPVLQRRLESFGIPQDDIKRLLRLFVRTVQSGALSTPEAHQQYGLSRFAQDLVDGPVQTNIDIIYSTILFNWASSSAHQEALEAAGISSSTIARIQALATAADRSYPAEEYWQARRMHRKIIMHVGPTNSGKTHNALRALAASGSGVYAGPLRLLAHEIWERLNLGQIVPLGVEEVAPGKQAKEEEEDTDTALDVAGKAVKKFGNPEYVRLCNMRTGEEQKIVAESAPLLSCTVEMLSTRKEYEVGVIDEIQMIADPQRGSAWTRALLGLCAKEVHLCGEETAVPVVRELLKDTGDELIVNRYERLTPLHVEEQTLDGDLSRVRKGDCIVTFSRSNIFAIKRRIETLTKMRCAVVYGMLPPEIRSEQAALFNDPDSGYDVIIGSDAIGMGLNLKIRRIVFEAVQKWDGVSERPLSVSQTKQIAGRAGRYGLHGNENPGGFTTSLLPGDVDFIRKTLSLTVPPLPYGRIGPTTETFSKLFAVMPSDASTKAIFDAHRYIARLPHTLRYDEMSEERLSAICEFVDTRGGGLPLPDRLMLVIAPIPWRDAACLDVIARFVVMLRDEMDVDFAAAMDDTDFMKNLIVVEERMASSARPRASSDMLGLLESLHKALVVYIWMSFRNPVVWNRIAEVVEMKGRVEKALDWTLQALTKNQPNDKDWKEHVKLQREQRLISYSSRRQLKEATAAAAAAA